MFLLYPEHVARCDIFSREQAQTLLTLSLHFLPQAFILEHPETGEPIPLAPEEFFTTSGAPLADTLGESFDGLVARVADTAADS